MNMLKEELVEPVVTGIIDTVEDPEDRVALLEDVIEALQSELATWEGTVTP